MFTSRKDVLNVGHRGARSIAPENTLIAAQKALARGADMWEMDVRLSADGELVVIHDANLERTSDAAGHPEFMERAPWPVHTFTLEDLRTLDFGSWFLEKDPFDQIALGRIPAEDLDQCRNTPIPTLKDVLTFGRDHDFPVNVEIKNIEGLPGSDEIAGRTAELIKTMDAVDLVIVSSFNHDYLRQVKKVAPEIATGALVSDLQSDPIGLLKELKAAAFHPHSKAVDPTKIHNIRHEGFMVNVWTVNSYETMSLFLTAGASALITDFPQVLKKVMDRSA